ncbi:MAG: cell envelope integrity protein CreD [bacterium]|nr:cell envelope integrity protein CreD [bacterium]
MYTDQRENGFADRMQSSIGVKLIIIGLLIGVLMIPVSMIKGVIEERDQRWHSAVEEISSKWGGEQVISGPVLSIPYRYYEGAGKNRQTHTAYAHFLPDYLNIDGEISPEIRYRGIYQAILYNTQASFKARFGRPAFDRLGIASKDVDWNGAFVSLGIPDLRGVRENIVVDWNGKTLSMNPGLNSNDVIATGVSTPVSVNPDKGQYSLAFKLNINGSGRLALLPVGKTTNVKLSSKWASPSFDGAFLPESREISDNGFKASWKVLHLNRSYPQYWRGNTYKLDDSAFGVKLFSPLDHYQKADRATKYAMLFILLTFAVFFVTEIMSRRRLHPIQYLLVGFALCLFYVMFPSLFEQFNFGLAYVMAGGAVVLLTAIYSGWIIGRSASLTIGCLLAALYGFLYILLQLEDYALLTGSLLLFAVLGTVMYVTRKVNWYAVSLEDEPLPVEAPVQIATEEV